jgi:hypothetical protein
MHGFLSKVSGWLSRHVDTTNRDYGDVPGDDSAERPESAAVALKEKIELDFERINLLKDAVEALAESSKKPGEAAGAIHGLAIGQPFGPGGPAIDHIPHHPHPIAGGAGSLVLGFVQGVVQGVFAGMLARVIMHDGNTAARTGPAPERDRQSDK